MKHSIFYLKKTYILVGLICLCQYQSFSQTKKKSLKEAFADINVVFKIPKDYIVIDDGFKSFECWDSKVWNGVQYTIMKNDSSVRIGFRFGKITANDISKIERFNPNWDPDKSYKRHAQAVADTINNKIIYYSKGKSRRKYNSKHTAVYSRNCISPYLKKYTYNKILFTTAVDYRRIYMAYLFTDKAKSLICKEIKKTESMVRFKD